MSSKGIKDLSARKPQNKTINALEENMGVFIISYREKANSLLKNHKDIKKIGKVNYKNPKTPAWENTVSQVKTTNDKRGGQGEHL
jgi:hypothetical protein